MHRSVKKSTFNLALTRTPPGPVPVVPKRPSFLSGEDASTPLSARLELIRRASSLCNEPEKNVKLAQRRYKPHDDRYARFARIFNEDDEISLDRPFLFQSAAEKTAAERYNKLLLSKQGPYKVVGVHENTLRTVQDRTKLALSSGRYSDRPNREEINSIEEETGSETDR